MYENKEYVLFPIGKRIAGGKGALVGIIPDYRPALKYLGLFSHVLVFWQYKGEKGIRVTTAGILSLNEKEGVLELDAAGAGDDAVIFDLKPYFPCEDRVKNPEVPDSMKKWPEWRPDIMRDTGGTAENMVGMLDSDRQDSLTIYQTGQIRKKEGEYWLEFRNERAQNVEALRGFSHVRILWWFDRFDKSTYRKITQCNPPYENAPRTGIFATRSPVRPNPIAMTTAKILKMDAQSGRLMVSELDAFDKTPIMDIIPYIPAQDRVKTFFVPDWLKHWPEWAEEREADHQYGSTALMDPDHDRIKEFMKSRGINEETITHIFDEEPDNMETDSAEIIIKGAKQNNLKNINLSIPKNRMTVITGVSGSGKSSLAFDTVYAESRRRFMDSMSAAGRALFEQLEKPDIEQIAGLPPAIAIEQKTVSRNPRSTVGTMTDLSDYLRLLFSKIGTRHCPECGRAVSPMKPEEIVRILAMLRPNTEFSIKAFGKEEILKSFKVPETEDSQSNLFLKDLREAVKQGLSLGNGAVMITIDQNESFLFQTKSMCYHCSRIFFELTASTFSFNHPESMCPVCNGLGVKLEVDPELIVSNPERSILDSASAWWGSLRKHRKQPNANWMKGEILALADEMAIDLELPWNKLPEAFRYQALYGSEGKEVSFTYENANGRKGEIVRPVEGAFNAISRLFRENSGDTANRIASAFMREKECPGCRGERLAAEGRMVSIGNVRYPETMGMTIEELKVWVTALPAILTEEQLKIAAPVLKELNRRLQKLINVGVSYLSLNRAVPTLSGGEAQRLRLAAQLGCGLTNLLYILDEPSIGLHPRDHRLLIKTIVSLRDAGNTVLVVEHDSDMMLAADRIIDMGPGAGAYGGRILAEGTPQEIMNNTISETGKYLKGEKKVGFAEKNSRKEPAGWIRIYGARENNLQNIDVSFPLGVFTCITGVSGSGKSSLVSKTLYPALARFLNGAEDIAGDYDRIDGFDQVDKVISVSQLPIGRTPRSNPATYTGVFDDIRELFASTEEAKKRGYRPNRFSFNSKEGQCEACGGEGRRCVEMHFMPDVWVSCSHCHGKRFNAETLEIKYNGRSISDVLDMDVDEALQFFTGNAKITGVLQTLYDVGLGYIKLGQSALTLSGGEAQRIKLAKELSRTASGKTVYILDEPTTGLHFTDIQNLLDMICRIRDAGNTVIVIEHNADMMKNADWIIDLGPDGGNAGGYVIAEGTPEEVAKAEGSCTGVILKALFSSER